MLIRWDHHQNKVKVVLLVLKVHCMVFLIELNISLSEFTQDFAPITWKLIPMLFYFHCCLLEHLKLCAYSYSEIKLPYILVMKAGFIHFLCNSVTCPNFKIFIVLKAKKYHYAEKELSSCFCVMIHRMMTHFL